jgi:enoyl-[acyl-carrier protein] reductase I
MTVETDLKPKAKAALMAGKRGLVMGVANDHSIAYGIARTLHAHGAELAFTFQNEIFARRTRPLAEALGSRLIVRCDVEDEPSLDQAFATLAKAWGRLDFVVHAIAYSDKEEFKGRYLETSRENFVRTLLVSCYSFTEVARRASGLMPEGGALLTLTYAGSERVMPHYNVMGVAKAGLEASVRYLAADLGPAGIRVNAISAGPMRTLAGSAVGSGRALYRFARQHSPLARNVTLDDVGQAALYLLSDLSAGVTGVIHYVDAGYHVIGMPGALVEGNGDVNGEG